MPQFVYMKTGDNYTPHGMVVRIKKDKKTWEAQVSNSINNCHDHFGPFSMNKCST